MLNKLEVRTDQGDLLTLPLQDISEGYLIQDIVGLDPVKATIVSSSFALLDGSQYQSSRRENRNIVLSLGLEPDWGSGTVQELRSRLYTFFMPKSNVNLRFFGTGAPTLNISGRVESFESSLFVKDPKVTISIICFDPDFTALTPSSIAGNTTAGLTETLITYSGTVETGIVFTLELNRSLTDFAIYHRPPDGVVKTLEFSSPMLDTNVLTISTVSGAKGATLLVGSTESSILYGISPYSKWIELVPGDNYIRVYAVGAAIPYTIDYVDRYGGL